MVMPETAEMLERRGLYYARFRQGVDRLAREYPNINWLLDTPETNAAEELLFQAKENYELGTGTLAEVKAAFDEWAKTQINKTNIRELF